jgi:DNA-binding LacI/PurR family transcriptional regulator
MGDAAVRMLLDLIRGASPEPPPLFPTALVVRDSTGPP